MERISKEKLVQNLELAIHCEVGWKGLQILLYGWLNFRKYGEKCYSSTVAGNTCYNVSSNFLTRSLFV